VREDTTIALAKSLVNLYKDERQLFRDNALDPPPHNPLRAVEDDQIDPMVIRNLEGLYRQFLEGAYLTSDLVQARRTDTSSIGYRIGRDEEYYRTGRAFYRYKEAPGAFFGDPVFGHELPGLGSELLRADLETGTTWQFGDAEFTHYEFRVYTAEHEVIPSDWGGISLPIDPPRHVGVVAGAWRCFRRKATQKTWEDGQIKDTSEYTRYEERFHTWLVANACAGSFRRDDKLELKACVSLSDYNDLMRLAYGIAPTDDGKYFPMRAVSYCVGTYGFDWVCHQLANAFALRRWNLIVVTNSPFQLAFGLVGRKHISRRKDMWGGIHNGCIPGEHCYYTTVPPYATDPATSQIIALGTSGNGSGLGHFWNPIKGKMVPTGAKWQQVTIPFSGLSRHRTEPGWSP